jgi:hypothetical protein
MEQIGLPQAGIGGGGSRVHPSLHHLISVTDLLLLRSLPVKEQPSRQRAAFPSKEMGRSESRFVTVCAPLDRTDGIIIVWTVRIEILPRKTDCYAPACRL